MNRLRRTIGRGALGAAAVGLFSFLLPGCQAPAPKAAPTAATVWIEDTDAFYEDALMTLRRNFFTPEVADREAGLILSRPETTKQWFEFWRKDSGDAFNTLEASLHTMQRVVRIDLTPQRPPAPPPASGLVLDTPKAQEMAARAAAAPQPYTLTVTVEKQRYSAPERQVTTTSGALAIYNERLPTTEGLRANRARSEAWIPMGRDARLEERLLARLTALPAVDDVDDAPATAEPPLMKS